MLLGPRGACGGAAGSSSCGAALNPISWDPTKEDPSEPAAQRLGEPPQALL